MSALHEGELSPSEDAIAHRMLRRELSSMGRLAAGVAYELEPHLTRILTGVSDALRVLGPGPRDLDARSALAEALDAAERTQAIVRGLAAFTAADAQQPGPVAVHDALELALQLAAHELRTRATVIRRYAPLPLVRATLSRLAHVFLELLRNAAESIPPSMPNANSIHVVTRVDDDGLVSVEIADTGTGIDSCDMPFLFDPFFTTKREERAVGLGLSTAYRTVAEFGGTISVESLVGRGSRFRVTLPRTSSFAEDALPDFSSHEGPPAQSVLCVGETLIAALRLGRLFGDRRVRVIYANAAQAFERLALGERFDLVVCDTRCATDLRSRVRRLAPDVLGRVFDVAARETCPALFEAPVPLWRRRRPLRLAARQIRTNRQP